MDWKTRLESCRNAVEALEHAETDVDRAFAREDRVGLLVAEREWNERRLEAMKRIRETFVALEDSHAITADLLETKLRELRPEYRPPEQQPVRPFAVELFLGAMVGVIFVFLLYQSGWWK